MLPTIYQDMEYLLFFIFE